MSPSSDSADIRLLRRLLAVPEDSEPRSEIDTNLALLAEATGAAVAHFELISHSPEHRVAATFPDAETEVCRGVIAAAQAAGRPLESANARLDPRLRDLSSVRRKGVDAVACVPIAALDLEGCVYLERFPGSGEFASMAVKAMQWFANQYTNIADRLVPQPHRMLHEETRRFQQRLVRAALDRSGWNVAGAARELKVTRNLVYNLLPEARRRRG